jgi:hypothetical protein
MPKETNFKRTTVAPRPLPFPSFYLRQNNTRPAAARSRAQRIHNALAIIKEALDLVADDDAVEFETVRE